VKGEFAVRFEHLQPLLSKVARFDLLAFIYHYLMEFVVVEEKDIRGR